MPASAVASSSLRPKSIFFFFFHSEKRELLLLLLVGETAARPSAAPRLKLSLRGEERRGKRYSQEIFSSTALFLSSFGLDAVH